MEKLIYDLYILNIGYEPNEEAFNKTLNTAKYLKDNGFNNIDIMKILNLALSEKDNSEIFVIGEDLPEMLWDNSLLKKNKFYYSEILHIKSKPPAWDPINFKEISEPFFLEMKINFTINDLLDYYYEKCKVPNGLKDNKKHSGALLHLINKYDKFEQVPGLDYVIALINKASQDINKSFVCDVFEIEEYAKEVIEDFENIYQQSVFEKTNKIVWRN